MGFTGGKTLTYGCGSTPMGSHLGVGAPPIVEPILVGIGMFTGGTERKKQSGETLKDEKRKAETAE